MTLKEHFSRVLREVSIDCVIFGFNAGKLKVLLVRWKSTDKWSLPGGRIYKNEGVEEAVERIVVDRTGLTGVFLQQFNTFGKMNRHAYYSEEETVSILEKALGETLVGLDISPRTVSIGYYALVNIDKVVPRPDVFSDECVWWDIDEVPKLLFDHNEMIEAAMKVVRKEIRYQPIGKLLPDKFTLNEIHKLFQTILNAELDRRNFHKLITSYDFLIKLNEKRTGAANKSPYLYRFDFKKYEKALKEGVAV
ncbi:MAG TPA: NUDIX domain-containing protein [Cyclobacteriaceae bacterium]|nr:NUDIX domain-containing protein [Cyclobacteriaceae bacterium]